MPDEIFLKNLKKSVITSEKFRFLNFASGKIPLQYMFNIIGIE